MWLRAIQIIQFVFFLGYFSFPATLYAQSESNDTIRAIQLKDVEVEASLQSISSSVSTYYPTLKQKNASFSGIDLLNRLAMPQLSLSFGNSVTTIANQPVNIFIDGIPATNNDMNNMRVTDVKKIEYYDYPSDPRFMGSAHVINFIMRKYEYGGYFKTSLSEQFIATDGSINLFGKLTVKRFTINIGLGGSYLNSKHNYTENTETYRLTDQTIFRTETVKYAQKKQNTYWPTIQTVISTDKMSIINTIGASFDHIPTDNVNGEIDYKPQVFNASEYSVRKNSSEHSLSYSGNWNFFIGNGNTITFNPVYSFSHSKQTYIHNDSENVFNNYAKDNTHALRSRLQFSHAFHNQSSLNIFGQGILYHSSTSYLGSTNVRDQLITYRIGPGISYGISVNNCYLYAGIGFNHDNSKYNLTNVHSTEPWADLSFQYSNNRKHRLSTEFHYMTSIPSASFRSEAVINSHSLFSYTGNPKLIPYKSFDYGVTYTFIPNKRFTMSVYANGWSVYDRYAFVYIPTQTGILRTIEQPCGVFTYLTSGISGRLYLLKRSLQLSGQVAVPYCYNSHPFNTVKAHLNYTLRAIWYWGSWNIGAQYVSDQGQAVDAVNGLWSVRKNRYSFSIGWGNSDWNVSTTISNPFSWNWISSLNHVYSPHYDNTQVSYSSDKHCNIKIRISYTVGFGKKIKRNGDVSRQVGAGSAILE